jgi:hypothetical protein
VGLWGPARHPAPGGGEIAISERDLRHVAAEPEWSKQTAMLSKGAAA